jgi:hypothetical protein
MSYVLRSVLPTECVDIIKEYTGEGCWRNGKYINIHLIPKDDFRYKMLLKRPRIRQLKYNCPAPFKCGSAWFKLQNGKFMVINVLNGNFWNGVFYEYGDLLEIHYNEKKIQRRLL